MSADVTEAPDRPRATGDAFNLARHCLAENARLRGEQTGLIIAEGDGGPPLRMSFAHVLEAVMRLAGGVARLDLPPRSRIVIRMGNEVDTVLLFFAVIAAGHVAVPTSMMLTTEDVRFVAADAEAAVVALGREAASESGFGDALALRPEELAALRQAAPLGDFAATAAEDPAYLVYTSGTTGRPKGVLHAHRVALGRRPMHQHWLGLRPGDVMLHAGAFNWTYTLGVGVLDPWSCGATAALARGVSDPAAWPRLIAALGATIFAATPGVYRQIMKRGWTEGLELPTLRHGVAAGEALAPALLAEWRARTGKPLYESFGMSEISTFISSGPATPPRPGAAGKPQPGRHIAVLPQDGGTDPLPDGQTGLLAIHRSDPGLMLGYWRRADEEAAASRGEWFVSGDLVSIDDEGYVWHHGRADDVMNALGYRVSPAEVEAALADHPCVADIGVTEWRAREDLSIIAAFVLLKEGFAADPAGLAAQAEERLASYKRPKAFHFVKALPRSPNGKLQRRLLATTVESGAAQA